MPTITIAEAARTTGWSPRMLRYLEQAGIVRVGRSKSSYRLYGEREVELFRRLGSLRRRFRFSVADVAFAARLRREPALGREIESWLAEAQAGQGPTQAWLDWEQHKHQRLLAA